MEKELKNTIVRFVIYSLLYFFVGFSFMKVYEYLTNFQGYHDAVIAGLAAKVPKEQYLTRVLFPFAIEYFVGNVPLYYLGDVVRLNKIAFILLFTITMLAFQYYLKYWFKEEIALIGTLFFALTIPYGYLIGGQVDILFNMFLFIISAILIRKNIFLPLFPIIIIGVLNRETILFVPFLYLLAQKEITLSVIKRSMALEISGLAVHGFIRAVRGGFGGINYSDAFLWNIACHHCAIALFLLFNIFWFLAFFRIGNKPQLLQRWALSVPFFIIANYHFGFNHETRLFFPLAIIIIPLALWNLFSPKEEVMLHQNH